jgi:hypothetical protein
VGHLRDVSGELPATGEYVLVLEPQDLGIEVEVRR